MKWTLHSLEALAHVAQNLIEASQNRKVWLLEGEMGAGKTTLITVLCKALGVQEATSSPTFALVNEYQGRNEPIYHFDFYRINNESEALDMGYEEYFYSGHYCFVEWPSKISNLLPEDALRIELKVEEDGSRVITMETP